MLKIIAAVDYSEASKHALRFILKATEKLDRDILVVNVVHLEGPPPSAMISSILESLKTKAYFDFQNLAAEMASEFGEDLPLRFHAEVGHPASKVIERVAKEENADLIVVGMKGMTAMQKVFLGSVAANLAIHSNYPVMIVPVECQIYPIEHIVDATDLYQSDDEFDAVMKFAHLFQAQVSMLHVVSNSEEEEEANIVAHKEELRKKYAEKDVKFVSQINKDVTDGIEDYTKQYPTDLLVVFTHKRLFYERLFNLSISKELTFDSKVSLLVLKSN